MGRPKLSPVKTTGVRMLRTVRKRSAGGGRRRRGGVRGCRGGPADQAAFDDVGHAGRSGGWSSGAGDRVDQAGERGPEEEVGHRVGVNGGGPGVGVEDRVPGRDRGAEAGRLMIAGSDVPVTTNRLPLSVVLMLLRNWSMGQGRGAGGGAGDEVGPPPAEPGGPDQDVVSRLGAPWPCRSGCGSWWRANSRRSRRVWPTNEVAAGRSSAAVGVDGEDPVDPGRVVVVAVPASRRRRRRSPVEEVVARRPRARRRRCRRR